MHKISYVIPCYKSEKTIQSVVKEIQSLMETHKEYGYELVLINDSSPDGTWNSIKELVSQNDNVTGIDMTRNFGQHSALMAGFRNMGSKINDLMANQMLSKPKTLYISSFFAMKRIIVDEILRYQNPYPYVIGLVLRSTDKICNVDVRHRSRLEGTSGYSLKKLLSLWMNGFTSFSVKPLRVATYAGLFTAFLGMIMTLYVIGIKLSNNPNTPMGWASTMAVVLVIGGMNLVVMGMVGEYVGRIYISIVWRMRHRR